MYILAKGDSMLPTLTDGEYYRIEPIENGEISTKDIIVFNINGITICHRVLVVIENNTKSIVQVSNFYDSGWIPDPRIIWDP